RRHRFAWSFLRARSHHESRAGHHLDAARHQHGEYQRRVSVQRLKHGRSSTTVLSDKGPVSANICARLGNSTGGNGENGRNEFLPSDLPPLTLLPPVS